jgi:hypothetical protein
VVNSSNLYNNGGRIGIGTTSPDLLLHIVRNDPISSMLRLESALLGYGSNIQFMGSNYNKLWSLSTKADYSGFSIRYSDTSASAIEDYLYVHENGNIGIGTVTPNSELNVVGNQAEITLRSTGNQFHHGAIVFEAKGSNAITNKRAMGLFMLDSLGGNEWFAGRPYGSDLGGSSDQFVIQRLATNVHNVAASGVADGANVPTGTQRLITLTSNGNLGVGRSNPTSALEVGGDAKVFGSTTSKFASGESVTLELPQSQPAVIFADSVNNKRADIRMTGTGDIRFSTGSISAGSNGQSTKMFIAEQGNVGVGTTTPQRRLHVSDVMRLEPRATAPTSPAKGDIYFDSTLNKLRVFDGTVWQNCW